MTSEASFFTDYDDPPVTEVAISVQFEQLKKLRTPHIGLLWKEYKGLTEIEEHPPLDQAFEIFGEEKLIPHFEISNMPPVRRCWFLNSDETELVQVQQDRFAHNWQRKDTSEKYPRYKNIRETFLEDLIIFIDFLNAHEIGSLNPIQCEVTYVNPIHAEADSGTLIKLQNLLTVYKAEYFDDFLPEPEDVNLRLRYIIPDDTGAPIGRLHISAQPVYPQDKPPLYLLNLTARGRPCGDGKEGVMKFLDIGHEWIVKGFTSITTKTMHSKWGIKNDSPNSSI